MNKKGAILFLKDKMAWHETEIERWFEIHDPDKEHRKGVHYATIYELDGRKLTSLQAQNAILAHKKHLAGYKSIIDFIESEVPE